jgi:hypothetical protein
VRMCLNPKVLAGLAVVAGGIYVSAPDLFLAALPFLVLAACPIGMGVMMWRVRGHSATVSGARTATRAEPDGH